MIFDTHAHYCDERFNDDRDEILSSMRENGVGNIVEVGDGVDSSKDAVILSKKYDFVYAAVGAHPDKAADMDESDVTRLLSLASNEKVVAIGEIGLDYHCGRESVDAQKRLFALQIELAKKKNLPIIVHSRDAAQDTIRIMTEHGADKIGGVMHCFSYSAQMARDCIKMGFFIGIGGVVTFKNAKKLVNVVKEIPLEAIVLETDSPYLAPEPNRGARNSSVYLKQVAKKIAQIKGISYDDVVDATEKNAGKLYGIDSL